MWSSLLFSALLVKTCNPCNGTEFATSWSHLEIWQQTKGFLQCKRRDLFKSILTQFSKDFSLPLPRNTFFPGWICWSHLFSTIFPFVGLWGVKMLLQVTNGQLMPKVEIFFRDTEYQLHSITKVVEPSYYSVPGLNCETPWDNTQV